MKLEQLFEAKVPPPAWMKEIEKELKALFKKFGFVFRFRPVSAAAWADDPNVWVLHGPFEELDDQMLSLEHRLSGLRLALAKKLLALRDSGVEISTYAPSGYPRHPLLNDDSLAYIEKRLENVFYYNTGAYSPLRMKFGFKKEEAPAPKVPAPQTIRIVKGKK